LTTHTLDNVHPADIFAVAPTTTQLLSASGSSSILVHSLPGSSPSATSSPEDNIPIHLQTIEKAHALGIHHLAVAAEGTLAVSAGFGGEVKIWQQEPDSKLWVQAGRIRESVLGPQKNGTNGANGSGNKEGGMAGELWALAMTRDGRYLAASSYDGRVRVWDMLTGTRDGTGKGKTDWEPEVVRDYETRGNFGMSVALV
jgi:superkiller protein 8